jgi:hypothetical protein
MWAKLALAALLAAFSWALLDLADSAFERGNAYPPWSSLRADANGTKLLHDSLQKLPAWTITRHFQSDAKLPAAPATVLFLNTDPLALARLTPTIDRLTAGGTRVLLGLPDRRQTLRKGQTNAIKVVEWLGLRLEPQSSGEAFEDGFEERTTWNLLPVDPAWQRGPRFAERPRGRGSIVILTGNELLSGQLRQAPSGDRLLRLLGPSHKVIFNEYSLGVADQGGIVTLLRRAGWGPAALLLLLAAALYLWRAATTILPTRPDALTRQEPAGAAAALSQLLRKHIPATLLLPTCLDEWKKATGLLPHWQTRRAHPSLHREPLEAYRQLQQTLREKPTL